MCFLWCFYLLSLIFCQVQTVIQSLLLMLRDMIINTVVFTNSITCICICIYVLYLAMDTRRKFSRVDKASSPSSLIFYRLLLVGCYSVIFYFCLSDDADLSSLILSIYASIFNINVCNCIIKVFFF